MDPEHAHRDASIDARRSVAPPHLVGDRVEEGLGLGDGRALGRDVAVVEAVEVDAELLAELEVDVDAVERGVERRVGRVLPRPHARAREAEDVGAVAAPRVPVADGEAQPLLHRLAEDHLVAGPRRQGRSVGPLLAVVVEEAWAGEGGGHFSARRGSSVAL